MAGADVCDRNLCHMGNGERIERRKGMLYEDRKNNLEEELTYYRAIGLLCEETEEGLWQRVDLEIQAAQEAVLE